MESFLERMLPFGFTFAEKQRIWKEMRAEQERLRRERREEEEHDLGFQALVEEEKHIKET